MFSGMRDDASAQAAENIATKEGGGQAEAAEAALAGKGWLPVAAHGGRSR